MTWYLKIRRLFIYYNDKIKSCLWKKSGDFEALYNMSEGKRTNEQSHTCHRHTPPRSCACIHWSWPSHSQGNAGRSAQWKVQEWRGKQSKSRDQMRKSFQKIHSREERWIRYVSALRLSLWLSSHAGCASVSADWWAELWPHQLQNRWAGWAREAIIQSSILSFLACQMRLFLFVHLYTQIYRQSLFILDSLSMYVDIWCYTYPQVLLNI